MKTDQQAIQFILDTLELCRDYFEDKEDADFEYEGGYIPNEEMKLNTKISNAIGHLKKLQLINQPAI